MLDSIEGAAAGARSGWVNEAAACWDSSLRWEAAVRLLPLLSAPEVVLAPSAVVVAVERADSDEEAEKWIGG